MPKRTTGCSKAVTAVTEREKKIPKQASYNEFCNYSSLDTSRYTRACPALMKQYFFLICNPKEIIKYSLLF